MKILRRSIPFDPEMNRTCVSCGNTFKGRYCNECGERVLLEGEESLKVFFGEILNAFTFLDGKFFRTLKLTITNPGRFTFEYSRGLRVPFMKPVSLFFVANFIFYLFPFLTANTLSTPLQYQHMSNFYGANVPQIIEEKLERTSMTREQLEKAYNTESLGLSKLLIIVLVFLLAVLFSIVNYKRSVYFANHLYFAFEYMTFFLFVNMIFLSIFMTGLLYALHWLDAVSGQVINDSIFTWIFGLTTAFFLIHGIHTCYGQRWIVSIAKALLIIVLMPFVFTIYKSMLFYLTMWRIA